MDAEQRSLTLPGGPGRLEHDPLRATVHGTLEPRYLRCSSVCTRIPAITGAGITAADLASQIGLICSRCARVAPHTPVTHRPFRHIMPGTTRVSLADGNVSGGAQGSFSSCSVQRCATHELEPSRRPPSSPRTRSTTTPRWIRA